MDVLDVFPMSDRERVSGGASLAGEDESLFRQFQRVAVALSAERDEHRLLELIVTKCADPGRLGVRPEARRRARPILLGWPT